MNEHVVLIHGLGESSLRMLPLALGFRLLGYRVTSLDYPSTLFGSETLAERFIRPAILRLGGEGPLHFVTHSLGGILLRYHLQHYSVPRLGKVVMMTPAHHGSIRLGLSRMNPLSRAYYGPILDQSGADESCFACSLEAKVDYRPGIIAGCVAVDPLSPFMPWPHDGKVTLESTFLQGMADHITLPCPHELITYHPLAFYEAEYFIRHGKFHHLVEPAPLEALTATSPRALPWASASHGAGRLSAARR